MNTVSGQIAENGASAISGSFTSSKIGTGQYTVSFDKNTFSHTPIVVITVLTDGEADTYTAAASLKNSTSASFTVSIQNLGGKSKDFPFNFIAVEAS